MASYSTERKESVLKKLLPPHNLSVSVLAKQEGITEATLYNWRKQAKKEGTPVPAVFFKIVVAKIMQRFSSFSVSACPG